MKKIKVRVFFTITKELEVEVDPTWDKDGINQFNEACEKATKVVEVFHPGASIEGIDEIMEE